jgi:hypothetical protein
MAFSKGAPTKKTSYLSGKPLAFFQKSDWQMRLSFKKKHGKSKNLPKKGAFLRKAGKFLTFSLFFFLFA